MLEVAAAKGKTDPDSKYRDYFNYAERLARVPSHRALAILRGKQEGVLSFKLQLPDELQEHPIQDIASANRLSVPHCSTWLLQTLQQSWKQKLAPMLENELIKQLRSQAETAAIDVFARNLRDLLLSALRVRM